MFKQGKYSNFYYVYLLIGVLSFGVVCVETSFNFYPTSAFSFGFPTIIRNLFLAWMLVGHYLFIRDLLESREIYNVEKLLRYILFSGLFVVGVYYFVDFLPALVHNFVQGTDLVQNPKVVPINPVLRHVLSLVSLYLIILFFLTVLILFKKLLFIKRTKREIQFWNIFQIVLLVSVIFIFTSFQIPSIVHYIYLEAGLVVVLLLTVRLKWIAFLTVQEKWSSILLLIPIALICFLLSKNLLEFKNPYVLQVDIFKNVFLLLSAAFVNLYTVFSLLALIFNLPIANFMEQRNKEVSSFYEINQVIQGRFHENEVFEKLFSISHHNTRSEGGWINIEDEHYGYEYFNKKNVSDKNIEAIQQAIHADRELTEENYLYFENLTKEDIFTDQQINNQVSSLLVFVLRANERMIGFLFLTKNYSHGFDEFMIRLVKTYIDQAGLAIENSEHIKEALEAERLKEEFEIAKSVQQQLLPKQMPDNEKIQMSGFSQPASEVGGDYYDYAQIGRHKYAAVIADVSGKGTSAAFHMSEMKGIFQSLVQKSTSPERFILNANEALYTCLNKNEFITLGYLLINTKKQKIRYYRGGQCPFLIYNSKAKEIKYYDDKGMALGILPNKSYKKYVKEQVISYSAGDFIVLVTDGVLEARPENKLLEFGSVRLKESVQGYLAEAKSPTAAEMNAYIRKKLFSFMKTSEDHFQPVFDDITLLILKLK